MSIDKLQKDNDKVLQIWQYTESKCVFTSDNSD